ncbi:MAG: FAD-dependent oxidoreductase [Candidatus Marinimicrobia bacterium]|nr:FAD-dependent oxidoreductase [Candidatus Neomarinimicrobiota bacterium]
MERSDVIIIGGGAVGLSCAYYLNQAGYNVTILDGGTADKKSSCSWGNSGMVVPSHIVPLAAPGVIKKGLKWLLDPESPFSIEFKPSLEMISWLWKFRRATNPNHVKAGAKVFRELGFTSRSLYLELGQEMDFGLESRGILMLCNSEKVLEEEFAISAMARELGMEGVDLDQRGVKAIETGMDTAILGGVHYPMDCNINPVLFLDVMQKYLRAGGVKIQYNTMIHGFQTNNGEIESVETKQGKWKANQFVLSAGSVAGKLAGIIGLKMPMMAGKGYSVTMESPVKKPALPAILIEARIASTPMGPNWRFGGTMTVTDSDRKINIRKLKAMLKSVQDYYPEYDLSWTEGLDPWVGLRPLSADGLPYIGPFKEYPNLIAATGHAMQGISLSPVTGKLVRDIISKKETGFDMDMLSPDRF